MKAKYIGEDNDYLSYGQVYDVTFEGNAKCVVRKNSEIICCLVGDNIKESFETILTHENKNTCSNCEECIYNRMCGSKEKYKQMITEYNELNEKWDIFESNPPCPEFKDIDKFAEENGYSKCTSEIKSDGDSITVKTKPMIDKENIEKAKYINCDNVNNKKFFEGYKPKYYFKVDKNSEHEKNSNNIYDKTKEETKKTVQNYNSTLTSKDLEKFFQECGLNPIMIIEDSSSVKEAKRVSNDLERKCQEVYEELLKGLLNS